MESKKGLKERRYISRKKDVYGLRWIEGREQNPLAMELKKLICIEEVKKRQKMATLIFGIARFFQRTFFSRNSNLQKIFFSTSQDDAFDDL